MQMWGTVISGFGPLLVFADPLLTVLDHFAPVGDHGPETTELTLLSSNQAFTFMSLTWILSRKNDKNLDSLILTYLLMCQCAVH